ncbi:MAG: DUF4396 domain-containing protein [Candidatus Eremiobacteraeota bacterium]|nr:DUF4396 domain-containing protein [Candidatus Eremiobacteraeota bacterium]
MVPVWLNLLAWVSLGVAFACAAAMLIDLLRHPQKMTIMNWVWPITALYAGPMAVWAYRKYGRAASQASAEHDGGPKKKKPFWAAVLIGVTHCGAGCTLGDIIAEFAIFFTGISLAGSVLLTEFAGDYVLAYAIGIVFQYFAIVPMRGLSPGPGIWAAMKADTLSLTAFEVGLFGWMAASYFVFFHPHLKPDQPTYWFMMQIGMLVGFATSYPMNWWLIRTGIKERM